MVDETRVCVSVGESADRASIEVLLGAFGATDVDLEQLSSAAATDSSIPSALCGASPNFCSTLYSTRISPKPKCCATSSRSGERFVAESLDDIAWLVHNETQCERRDGTSNLATGVRHASIRSARPN